MLRFPLTLLLVTAVPAPAQTLRPGEWDIKSTVVQLSVPGVPGFIQRMVKGRSKAERKRLAPGQGIEALLAPDPKAQCRIDSQRIADGHYAQSVSCPQKKGAPMLVERTGTYDAKGFAGRATVSGTSPRGPISIVLDQRAVPAGG